MKLLLDQDTSAGAAEILRGEGFDALHARDVGLSRADDADILEWCRRDGRVIITLDADFHALLALSGARSPSVVRIRIEGLRDRALADLIRRVIRSVGQELTRGSAVSVTATSIRLHALPLSPE
jgi:predicted nuclease of predicted toxin-antitoxin system